MKKVIFDYDEVLEIEERYETKLEEKDKEIKLLKEDNKSYQEYPFIIIEKNGVICRKNQEIERLNNIINKYEKWLNELGAWCYVEKLKELKESVK